MPITAEHAGRSYPATQPYRVSREAIAEFAHAVGDTTAGPDQDPAIASPTFAMVLAARAWEALFGDPELDLALVRTVHADQRFDWRRPIREGDELTATLRIDKVRTRGLTDMVTIGVQIDAQGGETVVTASSTLLHTRTEQDPA